MTASAQRSAARWLLAALVAAGVLVVFAQTCWFDFVLYDDDVYLTANPHVAQGLTPQSIAWAARSRYAGNWHPLTWISHLADVSLFGLERPGAHHAVNVALHAASAVLLLWLLVELTGLVWPAALAAALFALHPLRAESVAWVAERKDVLSMLLAMATLLAYLAYARRPRPGRYLLVLAAMGLGLAAKPALVTLPFGLLLLDWWPLGRWRPARWQPQGAWAPAQGSVPAGPAASSGRSADAPLLVGLPPVPFFRLVLEKLPLLALAGLSSAMTYLAQQGAGAITAGRDDFHLLARLQTAVVATAAYLVKFVWPTGLMCIYPQAAPGWPPHVWIGALVLVAGVTAMAFAWGRQKPYLLVGWLWYLGMLVPTSGIVKFGVHWMADRYTYLPQIGVALAVAFGVYDLARVRPLLRPVLAAGSVGWLLALAMLCARQTATWRNTDTLTAHALSVDPQNWVALAVRGFARASAAQLPEAVGLYRQAVAVHPSFAEAHVLLAEALILSGEGDAAIRHALLAIRAKPELADGHRALGTILLEAGRPREALPHLERARALKPESVDILCNLGVAHLRLNEPAKAVECFAAAVGVDSQSARAHTHLALAYQLQRRFAEARRHAEEAVRLAPQWAEARDNLGLVLGQQGDLEGSGRALRQALDADPGYYKAWLHLGAIDETQQRFADAAEAYRRALALRPGLPEAEIRLAWILATSPADELRSGPEAVALAEHASAATGHAHPQFLDTLAAAQAEMGQFPQAVAIAQRALEAARRAGQSNLADAVGRRLAQYRAGVPYRQPAAGQGAGQ